MDILLLLLAISGLTVILIHGTIVEKIGLRKLLDVNPFIKELTHCSMCLATWISISYGLLCFLVNEFISHTLFVIWTLPFAASVVCFILERFVVLLDNLNIKLEKDDKR